MTSKRKPVRRPKISLHTNVRNQSDRLSPIKLIVLHTTESPEHHGLTDLRAIYAWFDNPKSQVSAHVAVDEEAYSAIYVPDEKKAWACAAYNSASLNIEQIGFSTYSKALWSKQHRQQLKVVARWLAYWSKTHNVPLRTAKVFNGNVMRSGVTTHAALGVAGGDHHDPGPNYPFYLVLRMAGWYLKHGWVD